MAIASQHAAQIVLAIILTDSMNLLQKVWSLEWSARLAHSHAQSSAEKTSVDVLPWARQS